MRRPGKRMQRSTLRGRTDKSRDDGARARSDSVDLYGSQILDQPPYEFICCARSGVPGGPELISPYGHRPCSVGHVHATPVDDAAHVLSRILAAMASREARQIRHQDLELRCDGAVAETRTAVAGCTEALIEFRAAVTRELCRPGAVLHEQQGSADRQSEPQSAQRNARRPVSRFSPRRRKLAPLFAGAMPVRMDRPPVLAFPEPGVGTIRRLRSHRFLRIVHPSSISPRALISKSDAGAVLMTRPTRRWTSAFLAMSFVAAGCAAADRPVVVPITLLGHFPLVNVNIDGSEVPLVFDSGTSASVALTQAVLDRVKASPTGESSRGVDAQGNVLVYPKYSIKRVQIGAAIFTDVVAQLDVHDPSYQATQVGQLGFLGTSLLKGYQVVLDYPHRTMTLVPPGGPADETSKCAGTVVTFAPQWHGEPVAEVGTDLGRVVVWWDTGTPTSVLSKRFVQATGSPHSEATWTSRHLALGDIDFGPWQFEIWDMSLPLGFDGFIGYDFFAKHVVCMDFPAKRLLIQR